MVAGYDFSALAQILAKSGMSNADIERVFSPELGQLTGTFYENPETSAQDEELSWLQNAPNMRRALNLPDNDIRKIIAAAIYRGENPWDIRRQVEQYTAAQAELNPGVYNQEGETKDLLSFVNTIDSEWNKKTVSDLKKGADGSLLTKAGLPPKEATYSAQQLLPDLFDRLNTEASGLRAETNKVSISDKSKKAALKYLEQQKTQAAKEKSARQVPHPSDLDTESIPEALRRNLANTPMGRGEAGFMGLIPLYKMLEQVPAGAAALYRGISDPIYDEGIRQIDYIGRNTIGKGLPKLSLGKDPIGQFLYGKDRGQPKAAAGVNDAAERARFGRIAQDVVSRAENPQRKAAESQAKNKEQWMKDFTEILSTLVQERARSTGYTPYNEAVAARINFIAAGGK